MLVLSRQRDETIMIGDDIEVTVVDIRGDKVRLGINAPKEISVHRKEVYDAIRRINIASPQVKPEDLTGVGTVAPPDASAVTEMVVPVPTVEVNELPDGRVQTVVEVKNGETSPLIIKPAKTAT